MQPTNTREYLVQALRLHGPLTVAELSRLLGIGTTAVRQHVDKLQAEGSVRVAGLRRGRGRPRQLFVLTPNANHFFTQGYDALALDLLEAISRIADGSNLIQRILNVRQDLWSERYGPALAGKSLDKKLALLTKLLNEKGNLAKYEAQPDGAYLLTKHHCSISAVVAHYPQFCQAEQTWLVDILQAQVEEVQSRASGDPLCAFRIVPQPAQSQDRAVGASREGE